MAFDGTLKFDTAIDMAGFSTGLEGLGNLAKAGMNAVAGAAAAATGAMTVLGKQAVESYADFEQLAGGVETLFGESAQIVMNNAAKAFQTAGMSANEYMETATASAAAMVSSLAGDTKRAAELTDMAVVDMSDNINKMGSSAESVQNAYAGFAKGNFTMLDNLKLGYGGTKQEMERLLQTAQSLTGVQYNIDNYADIVQAIHAIQVEMHISGISAEEAAELVASGALTEEEAFARMGTTAKEARETISGSLAMVKAAWSNLLVGIADDSQDFDNLTDNFVSSVEAAASNILPRIEVAAGGLVKLVNGLSDEAVSLLTDLVGYVPMATDAGVQLMAALATGISANLPELLGAGRDTILSLSGGISAALPSLSGAVSGLAAGLAGMLSDSQILDSLLKTGLNMGLSMLSGFGDITVNFLDLGANLMTSLASGIATNLPKISGTSREILLRIIKAVGDNLPVMLKSGAQIVEMLSGAISDPEALTNLLDAGLQIITALAGILTENLSPILGAVIAIIGTMGEWLGEHALDLVSAGLVIVQAIVNAVIQNLPLLLDAAVQIVEGLAKGIEDDSADVLIAVENIIRTLLNFLLSPDTLQKIGKTGGEIIRALIPAAVELAGDLLGFAYDFFDETTAAVQKIQWGEIGKEIVEGIISGLIGAEFDLDVFFEDLWTDWWTGFTEIWDNTVQGFKDFLDDVLAIDWVGLGGDIIGGILDGIQNTDLGFLNGVRDSLLSGIKNLFEIESPITDISVDPAALEMMLTAPPMQSNFIQSSPTASITNHYTTNNSTTATTNNTTQAVSGGDIIIPVQIGGEQIETVVVTSAQIANARSGGATI